MRTTVLSGAIGVVSSRVREGGVPHVNPIRANRSVNPCPSPGRQDPIRREKLGSPYWVAATCGLAIACVIELSIVAFILRLRDPNHLHMPVVVFMVPTGLGLVTGVALRSSSATALRGGGRGVLTATAMIATTGLLIGLLYRGGWI